MLVGILLLVLAIAIVFASLPQRRPYGRHMKCAAQIRTTIQAMQIWANSNRDKYPLPSELDANNQTIASPARDKDHIGNVLSILIFNASISPEITVTPSEVSGSISINTKYHNSSPTSAVNPANALWDPSFSADWTRPEKGNVSYASLELSDSRLPRWTLNFNADEPVFGNRGPAITSIKRAPKGNALIDFDPQSLTLQIHGGRNTWEGNIGYNDGHVNLESRMDPLTTALPGFKPGKGPTDVLFADDAEDTTHTNAFLGVTIKGSPNPGASVMLRD